MMSAMKAHKRARTQPSMIIEELEPRILYSADGATLFELDSALQQAEVRMLDPLADPAVVDIGVGDWQIDAVVAAIQAPSQPAAASPSSSPQIAANSVRHELVFVDSGVANADRLITDLLDAAGDDRQLELVLLDGTRDGVDQISDALRSRSNVDAIHIISHGREGAVGLGASTLDFDTLLANANKIRGWSKALSDDADLLIYGCDVAASESGRSLIDALSRLTGADVAGSEDLTGSAALGGDWDLEYQVGTIDASEVLGGGAFASWNGVLAVAANGTPTSAHTDGAASLTWAHTVSAGANRVLVVELAVDTAAANVTGVTYGGVAMTQIGRGAGNHAVEMWGLVNPTAGTANVVASFGGITAAAGGATTYNGVDQSDPFGTFVSAAGTGTTAAVTAASAVGDQVIDVQYWKGNPSGGAPGAGQSLTWWKIGASMIGGSTVEAGAPSVVMSGSFGASTQWEIGAVSLHAATSGITVSPIGGLSTTEAGGTAQFSIVLDTPPIADVNIGLSSSNTGEGTLSTSSLTFTAANWNVAQTVTVTGVDDNYIDGDIGYSVVTAAANSADANYNGLNASDVSLTNIDTDSVNTLIVDTASDSADGNTSSISALMANKGADGVISLREAIAASNNTLNGAGGADRIAFAIPGAGAHTISLLSSLPAITDAVVIDGSTQSGYLVGTPTIVIDGTLAGANANAIVLRSSDSTVTGLHIRNFDQGGSSTTGVAILIDGRTGGGDRNTVSYNVLTNNSASATGGVGAISIAGAADSNHIDYNILLNNNADGIRFADGLSTGNTITYNAIDGQGDDGVKLAGANITFSNNTVSNTMRLSSHAAGIEVSGASGATLIANNTITAAGTEGGVWIVGSTGVTVRDNTIVNGKGAGIAIDTASTGNALLRNSISGNVGLGIDLLEAGVPGTGVTANDALDADSGANGLQNYPALTAATTNAGTQLVVAGSLVGAANSYYRIEFYANASPDASGYGEGQTYLGYANVATDGAGNATINATLSTNVAAGVSISATATATNAGYGSFGNTSEFSAVIAATPPNSAPAGSNGAITATENLTYIFSGSEFGFTDSDGNSMLRVWFDTLPSAGTLKWNGAAISAGNWINATDIANGLLTYTPPANVSGTGVASFKFRVQDDGGTTLGGSDTDPTQSTLAIDITAVSSPPVNTVPGAQSTNEDTAKVFSSTHGNQISIVDVDADSLENQVTLSVSHGRLTLSRTTGLTFITGDGSADATMTLRGLAADINAALNGLTYTPVDDFNGTDTLTLTTKDAVLTSIDLDVSLKARYAFEDSATLGTDSSPAASYNGVVVNAAAVADPTRGNVLSLSGTGYIQSSSQFGNPTNVTLAAWINLTAADANGADVISLGDNLVLRADSGGKLKGVFWDGVAYRFFETVTTLAGTGWRHVALTFDDVNNVQKLYLDGSVVATTSYTGSISYAFGANSFIGKHGNGATTYDFNGQIDDARIYGRALTGGEIAALATDLNLVDRDTVALTVSPVNDAPTFNAASGVVTTPVGAGDDWAYAMALQSDGKIVTAGYAANGTDDDFVVVRYNTDGSLDAGFGTAGKVRFGFGAGADRAYSVAIGGDGKIVIAGLSVGATQDFAVARLNSDGSFDTGFSSDGKTTVDFGGLIDDAQALVVQSDGRILIAGTSGSTFAMARLIVDGSLDTTFGVGGKVTTSLTGVALGYALAVQGDGKVVLAGTVNGDLALLRYGSDGTLDTTFGGAGSVVTDIAGGFDVARALAVQADGKIVVGGYGSADFVVARYTSAGVLDPTFGGIGVVRTDMGGSDFATELMLQSDGKIVLGGYDGLYNTALARYNSDGSLDDSFGNAGKVITLLGANSFAEGIVQRADGRLVVAVTATSVNRDLGLVSYLPAGDLDAAFPAAAAANTLNGTPTYTENGAPVVLDSDVRIFDAELSLSNFKGATLTLARNGGASAQDLIAFDGATVTTSGANVLVNGVVVGTYTFSGGQMSIGFSANATQSHVNLLMQNIKYANVSNAPPTSVQIDWTFSDGNVGAQGSGGAGTCVAGTVVTIVGVNDAPTGQPSIIGTPTEDMTLTANTAGIFDADGLGAYGYQWLRNGSAIAGASASSYVLGDADVGANISVRVHYTDGGGTLETLTSAAVGPIANVNDAPTGAPVITGTLTEDQTLSADTSAIVDADGVGSYTYQWLRNGSLIAGATAGTYTLGDADVGASIGVTVRYTDGHGTLETLTGAAVGPVVNVNDAPTGSPTIGGTATEDQMLTANTGAIADVDGIGTFAYQWLRNGVAISGATASTYTLGDADVGTHISVQVSYTDGHGTAESLGSATVGPIANVNDAPVIISDGGGSSASVSMAENNVVVTSVAATDSDVPADALTYSIVGGADQSLFLIDANTGALIFATAPDAEAPADANGDGVYNVVVQVDDGNGGVDTQAIAVNVTDVNEFAVGALGDANVAANQVSEGAATGTVVGVTASASDADATASVTYSLTNNAGGRFAINAATGVVTVANGALLNAALSTVHAIDVLATSSDGSTSAMSLSIDVKAAASVVAPVIYPPIDPPIDSSKDPLPKPSSIAEPAPAKPAVIAQHVEEPETSSAPLIKTVVERAHEPAPALLPGVTAPQPEQGGIRRGGSTSVAAADGRPDLRIRRAAFRIDGATFLIDKLGLDWRVAAANVLQQDWLGLPSGSHLETQLDEAGRETQQKNVLTIAASAKIGGAIASAGVVAWVLRSGGLLTSLLVSTPAWRHLDPIPVLAPDDDKPDWGNDPDSEREREERAALRLFRSEQGEGPQEDRL